MNELVTFNKSKKQIVVSSRQVAEHFEKEHKHVLEAIRNKIQSAEKSADWFYSTTYKDEKGRKYPEYLMNRNGFAMLVMGFTGAKAAEWQVKYIEAFEAMEAELKKPSLKTRTVGGALKDVLSARNSILKMIPGVQPNIALVTAFEQIEEARHIDLSITKRLIPPATQEEASCNLKPTDIAVKCNFLGKNGSPSGKMANIALQTLGLQERNDKGDWVLTAKGQKYGAMFPYSKNNHSGYEIRWKESVTELMTEDDDEQH